MSHRDRVYDAPEGFTELAARPSRRSRPAGHRARSVRDPVPPRVAGLLKNLEFERVEPMRALLKDEVWAVGAELGPHEQRVHSNAVRATRSSYDYWRASS